MITVASVRDIPTNAIRAVTQSDGTILVYMPGDTLPPAPQPDLAALLAEAKASAHASIDAAAGQIVRDVVGDRAEEYRQAEDEAKAWAAAQYTGNAPPSVASWALASGLAPQAACDSILAQAAAWRVALQAIRAARLQLKALATSGKPELALAQWAEFERGMRAMLTS